MMDTSPFDTIYDQLPSDTLLRGSLGELDTLNDQDFCLLVRLRAHPKGWEIPLAALSAFCRHHPATVLRSLARLEAARLVRVDRGGGRRLSVYHPL